MAKLVESTFMALNGFIGSPQEWRPPYWDDEHVAYATKLLFAADALLLGRTTYDGFAQAWPGSIDGIDTTHLELVESTRFASGIVVNAYAPK